MSRTVSEVIAGHGAGSAKRIEHLISRGHISVDTYGRGRQRYIGAEEQRVLDVLLKLIGIGMHWDKAASIARQLVESPGPVLLPGGLWISLDVRYERPAEAVA